jgi:hypothetical protein
LGTATRLDFASVTVQIPWTSRTIKYAEVQIGARDVFTTVTDFDEVRVGVKIDAVAFGDTDYTVTPANTGDHTRFEVRRNATTYCATNDPGTASFTLQIGTAFHTGAASNVTGVTGLVLLTVEYDDTSGSGVAVKTVGFPIQSHHTTISTSYVEVGTTGGTSNAPANQIQQLTGGGVLPESSITVDFNWIDVYGIELATTSRTFTYRGDGTTDNARFTCDQTLVTTVDYFDRWDLKTAGAAGAALSTTAAHAWEVKGDQTSKAENFGGIHWVTYRYDPTSSTQLVSLLLPLTNGRSNQLGITDSTSTDSERFQILVDIQEPTTITMKQSGVVLHSLMNAVTRNVLADGQTARAYTIASDTTRNNGVTLVHRGDHSSSTWTLARGKNRLSLDIYSGTETANNMHTGGYAIVNYHCGVSPSGAGAHNHSVLWGITDYVETAAVTRTNISPTAPAIPETIFRLQSVFADLVTWIGAVAHTMLLAERASGEAGGAGWQATQGMTMGNSAAELGAKRSAQDITDWWRANPFYSDADRLNIETSRSWQLWSTSAWQGQVSLWATYHANHFTVAGTVEKDGAAVANGGIVTVWADDGSGNFSERVTDTTIAGGAGGFTVEVCDNTRSYHVLYQGSGDIAAAAGIPTDDAFDISFFSGGGTASFSMAQLVN